MSFNMIPTILVDSVVLPNKPLSNLEIIDAAKKLALDGFRGVFLSKLKRMVYMILFSYLLRLLSLCNA